MKRDKALRIIREFENAVRDDEMRGSMRLDDRESIHQRYLVLKERLLLTLLDIPTAHRAQ